MENKIKMTNKNEYKAREITPSKMMCAIGMCPSIYDGCGEDYLIVGKKVDPSEFGLEKKVGEDEVLISISKKIIDEKQK
jgi:hypothetical protein|tara:strand:+ start:114 stop:350 length:237 start_codon:yes stop_codon:yes gene_type:complete